MYHNSMGEVSVGLGLQPHSIELGWHISLWTGLAERSPSDFGHLGCDEKWQHTLLEERETSKHTSYRNWQRALDRCFSVVIYKYSCIKIVIYIKPRILTVFLVSSPGWWCHSSCIQLAVLGRRSPQKPVEDKGKLLKSCSSLSIKT